jgi:drug/metabolite transporter (DMT)-like permease
MILCNKKKAILAMLILSVSYGISGFTARELQQHFGIWQQIAIQSWSGLLLSLVIQKLFPSNLDRNPMAGSALMGLIGRALIGRIVGSFFFIQACLYAPLGNVGWISALPTSAIFGWLFFGQSISIREWCLLALGMSGVAMIVGPSIGQEIIGIGEIYALLSVFALGLASLLGRQAVREQGAIIATSWVIFFTALCSTAAAFLIEGGIKMPPLQALPVLLLVSVMVVLGSACSLYGFTYLRASTATALLSLEAIWGVALGMSYYGEIPTTYSLVGGSLIVIVAYLTTPKQAPQQLVGIQLEAQPIVEPAEGALLLESCRRCSPRIA